MFGMRQLARNVNAGDINLVFPRAATGGIVLPAIPELVSLAFLEIEIAGISFGFTNRGTKGSLIREASHLF